MRRRTAVLALLATVAATLIATPATTQAAATQGPGALSHFDLARKDCLGTARNTTSKVWYTVAGGVLSDVYAPTIDTTNVETMQYVVTDGSSFTDLQSRDTTYHVSTDLTGMTCTVTSLANSGAYELITTYLTDPARDSVVVHTTYSPLTVAAKSFHLYVRLDATVAGNGGGGSGNGGADSATVDRSTGSAVPVSYDTNTVTNAVNRDYAVPSFLALGAQPAFGAVSSGYVGTAGDGLTQLQTDRHLTATDSVTSGNVEQTAEVHLAPGASPSVTLALGFGTTQAAAVRTAGATLATKYSTLTSTYQRQWTQYDAKLKPVSSHLAGMTGAQQAQTVLAYYAAANTVKASEDKTFPGAVSASLASPWGQSVSAGDPNNTYFGSYREVFARDLYEAFTAFLTDGDLATAQATTRFLFLRQQLADGSMPRNSLTNGRTAPDSFNTQLDEVAYPILMAQQSGLGQDSTLWPHIKGAADYLISHGPAAGPERWEEQGGYSPSTIAAEIAGLVAAGTIAQGHGDTADARIWLATADVYQRSIKGWTVTTNGPKSAQPYFIRLSKTGDPNAAISYDVGNGGPTTDQRSVIDAGFLELVRLGELPANDPQILNSLTVVDSTIERSTASGPGWLRYDGDGYGDCHVPDGNGNCTVEGAPWAPTGKGVGHVWPVLSAERAEQSRATGDAVGAGALLVAMEAMSSGVGLVPEQAWDDPSVARSPAGTAPETASIGFVDGKPVGSAAPLTWGSASLVRLAADLSAGRTVEQPTDTTARYVTHQQGSTPLTVTSPADQTAAGNPIVVRGTTSPGASVDIADVAVDRNTATTTTTVTASSTGAFTASFAPAAGTNTLVVTATATDGGTAQTIRTLVNDVVDGTLLLDVADPTGDDNGPGHYAYPTNGAFVPGAYDLTRFQVYDTGSTVTFRVQTRDLTPTFGSALGAQLVDVYVDRGDGGSTASSFPQRNYSLAQPWSRLIEVQGYGQRFIDPAGTTLGTVTIGANAISRYITFSVDKAQLGMPGAGWNFTVTLTGQDGYSPDQARAFTSTPGQYSFGVCAPGDTDAHCGVDPNTVPKVMDTVVPAGVSQSGELDYLGGPVVLHGVPLT